MVATTILIATAIALCFFFMQGREEQEHKTQMQKVTENSWIVNGEFVTVGETDADRMQQKLQDKQMYLEYERNRKLDEMDTVMGEWMKTKRAIAQNPELKNSVTQEELDDITEKYDRYVRFCRNIDQEFLSKEEFLIKEKNPVECAEIFKMGLIRPYAKSGIYHVYAPSVAKYAIGNEKELMSKEYEQKWYN